MIEIPARGEILHYLITWITAKKGRVRARRSGTPSSQNPASRFPALGSSILVLQPGHLSYTWLRVSDKNPIPFNFIEE